MWGESMGDRVTPCKETKCFAPEMYLHTQTWCSGPFSELLHIPLRSGRTDFWVLAWSPSPCRQEGQATDVKWTHTSNLQFGFCPFHCAYTTRETHPYPPVGHKIPEKIRKVSEWAKKSLSFGLNTKKGKVGSVSDVWGLVKLEDTSCLAPLPLTCKPL